MACVFWRAYNICGHHIRVVQVKWKDLATNIDLTRFLWPWLMRSPVPLSTATAAFTRVLQVKWKDLATDLDLTPCSLNPERADANAGLPLAAKLIKQMTNASDEMTVRVGAHSACHPAGHLDLLTGAACLPACLPARMPS